MYVGRGNLELESDEVESMMIDSKNISTGTCHRSDFRRLGSQR